MQNTLLGNYINGNFSVSIFRDGTKIRENGLDFFEAQFPECIDLKITDYCDAGCAFCHENSTRQGKHANLSAEFINTLKPHTELAIGGGNPLDHPDLVWFLKELKNRNIIPNLTVNQIHFEKMQEFLKELLREGLIYGLGVSLVNPTDKFLELISQEEFKDIIIHVVSGVVTKKSIEAMYDKNIKILILGYKNIRRGKDYYSESVENRKAEMYDNLENMRERFSIISFDNLALEQLKVRRLVSDSDWNNFYMGNDGEFTMYIDLVKEEFSKSSTCPIRFPIQIEIIDMFDIVKTIKA